MPVPRLSANRSFARFAIVPPFQVGFDYAAPVISPRLPSRPSTYYLRALLLPFFSCSSAV
jgi:hypothetical protein